MRAPPFSFILGAEYIINGYTLAVKAFDPATGRVDLWCPVTRSRDLAFTVSELADLRRKGKLEVAADAEVKHTPSGKLPARLKDETRALVTRRTAYATACAKLYPVGPLSKRLREEIDEVARRIRDTRPPSPHSVYRWVRRYVLSNYDTAVFVQDAGAIRERTPRIDARVHSLLRDQIQELLGRDVGATLNGVMNEALARVAKQLGYPTFRTKEGEEFTPDEYLLALGQDPDATATTEASCER